MTRKKVYLSDPISPTAYRRLQANVEIVSDFNRPEELDAIIMRQAYCPREVIERCQGVKIIAMHGVGTDRIDMEAAAEFGIPVTTVPGGASQSVAELAVADLLALDRQLKRINIGLCQGRYHHFGEAGLITHEIDGTTLGLVGTGHIARCVARIMSAAFHVRLLCFNPHRSAEECRAMGFEQISTLTELFSRCNFVNVSVTLSPQTRNMIDAKVLAAARPGLILVNTSRGGIVNENDLYQALVSGRLGGAASDVFDHEPPLPDSPLINLENFIATFHVGGSTAEAMERVGNIVVDNVFRALGIEESHEAIDWVKH